MILLVRQFQATTRRSSLLDNTRFRLNIDDVIDDIRSSSQLNVDDAIDDTTDNMRRSDDNMSYQLNSDDEKPSTIITNNSRMTKKTSML